MSILAKLKNPIRRHFEAKYARHYGWNLDSMREYDFASSRWDPYTVDGPLQRLRDARRPVDRIQVIPFGRFGNHVIQLKHALYTASSLSARSVVIERPEDLFTLQPGNALVVDERPNPHTPHEETVLRGHFYYERTVRFPLTPSDHARLSTQHIRPLLKPSLLEPDPRVGAEDMVMHFRAGDIMVSGGVNPDYGQPPVSYYLKAATLSGAKRVWLVYEDMSNPAVCAVQDRLEAAGFEVLLQSGRLEEDARLILSARKFAAATGTFGYALAELSQNLNQLFSFYEFKTYPLSVFAGRHFDVVCIEDGNGAYKSAVLNGNWEMSPVQVDLMLNYPSEHLSIRPVPAIP